MKVFLPQPTGHILKIIPRAYEVNVTLEITDECTGVLTSNEVIATNNDGFMSIPFSYPMQESGSYFIEVKKDGTLLWRGKGFCTAQIDLENYNINNELLTA